MQALISYKKMFPFNTNLGLALNLFPLPFLFNLQNGFSSILSKEFIVIIEIETCPHGA